MNHIPAGRRRYVFNPKMGRLEEVVPENSPFHWLSLLPASYAKPRDIDWDKLDNGAGVPPFRLEVKKSELSEDTRRTLERSVRQWEDKRQYGSIPLVFHEPEKSTSDTPPITWHKLSEKKPTKEGTYLTWFPAGSLVYPELAYQNVKAKRWGIQDKSSTEMSFFNLSITHWAEFNLPEEEKE